MAQVVFIDDTPNLPPLKEVVLTLTPTEAGGLARLLGNGTTLPVLYSLGLYDLWRNLENNKRLDNFKPKVAFSGYSKVV